MSNRQKNVTLTKDQQQYVISHTDESIRTIARKFKVSNAKVSMNLKIMGLSRETPIRYQWENKDGTFNETEFAKLYSY